MNYKSYLIKILEFFDQCGPTPDTHFGLKIPGRKIAHRFDVLIYELHYCDLTYEECKKLSDFRNEIFFCSSLDQYYTIQKKISKELYNLS